MDIDRLKQLASQAKPCILIGDLDDDSLLTIARIAELVIRDCADMAFNQWVDNGSEESARPTVLREWGLE